MKDDTVRRLQALEDEYAVTTDANGEGRDELFDVFGADFPVLEAVHGDAA